MRPRDYFEIGVLTGQIIGKLAREHEDTLHRVYRRAFKAARAELSGARAYRRWIASLPVTDQRR